MKLYKYETVIHCEEDNKKVGYVFAEDNYNATVAVAKKYNCDWLEMEIKFTELIESVEDKVIEEEEIQFIFDIL